jgi:hypothetical protein
VNLRTAFEDTAKAVDDIVPRLAGSLVAYGKVAEYRQLLGAAKQLRALIDDAIKSGELDSAMLAFGVTTEVETSRSAELGLGGAVVQVKEHRHAIHLAVDGILAGIDNTARETRQQVANAFAAIDENVEQLVHLAAKFPKP